MTDDAATPTKPTTEAGRRLLATTRSFIEMEEGHPAWLAVGLPMNIVAIEQEARAAVLRDTVGIDAERLAEAIRAALSDDDVPQHERPRPAQVAAEYDRLTEAQKVEP